MNIVDKLINGFELAETGNYSLTDEEKQLIDMCFENGKPKDLDGGSTGYNKKDRLIFKMYWLLVDYDSQIQRLKHANHISR